VLRLKFTEDLRYIDVQEHFNIFSEIEIDSRNINMASSEIFLAQSKAEISKIFLNRVSKIFGMAIFIYKSRATTLYSSENFEIPTSGYLKQLSRVINLPESFLSDSSKKDWLEFYYGFLKGSTMMVKENKIDADYLSKKKYSTPYDAGFLLGVGLCNLIDIEELFLHEMLNDSFELLTITILILSSKLIKFSNYQVSSRLFAVHMPQIFFWSQKSIKTNSVFWCSAFVQTVAMFCYSLTKIGTANLAYAYEILAQVKSQSIIENSKKHSKITINKECIANIAGIAFGLIFFKQAKKFNALKKVECFDLLSSMINGSKSENEEFNHNPACYNPKNLKNVHCSSIGALLALGLSYFDSKNKKSLELTIIPSNYKDLLNIRPDIATFKIISHGLISWSQIEADIEWIEKQIPEIIRLNAFKSAEGNSRYDPYFLSELWCHIVMGCCTIYGLKFSGTYDSKAEKILKKIFEELLIIEENANASKYIDNELLNQTYGSICLALSLVLIGSCDLETTKMIFKMVKFNESDFSSLFIGNLALGFLYMSAGRYSLVKSESLIPLLLVAIFPKFPKSFEDNSNYIQILRFMFFKDLKTRILMTLDDKSLKPISIPIEIEHNNCLIFKSYTPCNYSLEDRIIKVGSNRYRQKYLTVNKINADHQLALKMSIKSGEISEEYDPTVFFDIIFCTFLKGFLSSKLKNLDENVIRYIDPNLIGDIKHFNLDNLSLGQKNAMKYCIHIDKFDIWPVFIELKNSKLKDDKEFISALYIALKDKMPNVVKYLFENEILS
ncbi:MAG: hypothetical protein MHPSP_000079, partial [Paramarteilia canceri]